MSLWLPYNIVEVNRNPFEQLIIDVVKKSSKEELKKFFIDYINAAGNETVNDSKNDAVNMLYIFISKNYPEYIKMFDTILLLK